MKSSAIEAKYLVLDIGTSDIKCGCVDSKNKILTQHHKKFPLIEDQHTFEIDFTLFSRIAQNLLAECLLDQTIREFKINALLITSQAQTFVPVDSDFNPLRKGIVWLDERAIQEAAYLKERLPDFTVSSGFKQPLASLYVSKLLWLKQNESLVFKKAIAFPLINEYLAFKLTGKFFTDTTNFGMSGIYNFRQNELNQDILDILGLQKSNFPKVGKAATIGEMIADRTQKGWNLNYKFPVYLCGNDQGASACGAGVKEPGDLNINFGTAMVFYSLTETLTTNLTNNQIAGKHPIGDSYFLLNFENDYGIKIRMLKEKFFKYDTYDKLFKTYWQYQDVQERIPNVDVEEATISEKGAHKLTAGVINHYLTRLKSHLDQIQKTTPIKNITLSGGMIKSEVWLNILRDTLRASFIINNRAEAGLLGAVNIYLYNNRMN